MEPGDSLRQNDTYVSALAQALTKASSIANVPGLLRQIIENDMWRERLCKQTGKQVTFRRFADFVAAYPPEGLGTDLPTLRDVCRRDPPALDALAQVETSQGYRSDFHNNVMDVPGDNIQGNSATYTLRRLAKDAPQLHARVVAGELSPNAAAIEAGFRDKKFQMPADPDAAGRYLAQRVDREWIRAMLDAYGEGEP